MKPLSKLYRFAAALVAALLLTTLGCDSTDPDLGEYSGLRAAQPEPFRIDCFTSKHAEALFVATGAIDDNGTVSGDALPWNVDGNGPEDWKGLRSFHGEYGEIDVYVEAIQENGESGVARGEFIVVRGSDSYANLNADGDFELVLDGNGRLAEVFDGTVYPSR